MSIWDTIWHDLTDWQQIENLYDTENSVTFDCTIWSRWLANSWYLVWGALAIYIPMVMFGPGIMANRTRIYNKTLLFSWNSLLATFSTLGFWTVLPKLLFSPDAGVLTKGLRASVCVQSSWYGNGYPGLFVFLFIVSKIAELIDTVWLVLGKRPLIFLHWYHHITVLIFCWHSYYKWTSSGIWFACINYGVHAIMYTYYSFTQYSPAGKEFVRPFAPHIMKIQIIQMVAGLFIIVANGFFAYQDPEGCPYHNWSNTIMGFLMYVSYFLLFGQLYLNRFMKKKRQEKAEMKKIA